jgi:hypothetical protein
VVWCDVARGEELLELQGGQSSGTKNCRQMNPV